MRTVHGLFVLWRLGQWTVRISNPCIDPFRTIDGLFVPWAVRTVLGLFVLWTVRTVDWEWTNRTEP